MNLINYKHCSKCDNVYLRKTGFYPNSARDDKTAVYCRDCQDNYDDKNKTRTVREVVVNALGAKCLHCGYDKNIQSLQIDHVKSNGFLERIDIGLSNTLYKHMVKNIDSGDYQVLCANCNFIKRYTNEECKREVEQMPEPIIGTERENFLANKIDGRTVKGRQAPNRKITNEQIEKIKELQSLGIKTNKISEITNVSPSNIYNLNKNKHNKGLDGYQGFLNINANLKHCKKCDNVFLKNAFYEDKSRVDKLGTYCKSCQNNLNSKTKSQVKREEIVHKLGGKCVKCGYNEDVKALQIDHINGGGRQEIQSFSSITKYYKNINNNLNNYQILCCNCNQSKKFINKEYGNSRKPMPEPITGELREAVLAAKAPEQGRFIKGQKSNKRICSDEQVMLIKQKLEQGIMGSVIAKELGVSQSIVSRIKKGQTYTI